MKKLIFGLSLLLAAVSVTAQTQPATPTTSGSQTQPGKQTTNGSQMQTQSNMQTTNGSQTPQTTYWYYPQQNIYYNDVSKDYWYYDKSSTKWMSGQTLSDSYTPLADGDTRYKVSYAGKDVWKGNATDKTKYKVKNNGTMKSKTKPSGN